MDSKNFDCGFIIYLILRAKPKKHFGNGGDQIFNQICLRDDFFQNRGKFELKLKIWIAMGSIRGVKNLNMDYKT